MTRDEAKLILQVCRASDADAGDAFFCEALTLAKNDPELAAWLARQQKFDALVSGGLQQVRAPSRLKAEILALGKKSEPAESPISVWWKSLFSMQSPVAWAMAAAIVILLSLAVFWKPSQSPARFADFSAQMVHAAVNDANHVDVGNKDMKQVVAWLAEHHGENKFVLPTALNGESGLAGCRILDWHGQKVSMLCYGLKDSGHVDLFVAEAKVFPDAPPVDAPQFASSDGMPTASWSHDGKVYLMVGHGDMTDLEKVFQPKTAVKMRLLANISNSTSFSGINFRLASLISEGRRADGFPFERRSDKNKNQIKTL
jgi:anti-sigma factor RsiW